MINEPMMVFIAACGLYAIIVGILLDKRIRKKEFIVSKKPTTPEPKDD